MQLLTVLMVFLLPVHAPAGDSLLVEVAGRPVVLHADDLSPLARDTARTSFHGGPTLTYTGPRLTDVLRLAGVASDSLHGALLAACIVVEAADGYRVAFSLPEVAPALGNRVVLMVDRLDGKPLPPSEGPWRLAVPADGEHARVL